LQEQASERKRDRKNLLGILQLPVVVMPEEVEKKLFYT
jgi:hypothetical protein